MTKTETDLGRFDDLLLNTSEYAVTIVGRDLPSYLTALILKQHGYRVAIISPLRTPVMTDLSEYISLKYLYEAARRLHSIQSLHPKGLRAQSDGTKPIFDWQELKTQCKHEYLTIKDNLEKEISKKDIPIYEGKIVMIEDQIVRIINEDETHQIAVLRTKYVIVGSSLCRNILKNSSKTIHKSFVLKTITDFIHLDLMPKSLSIIGGGTVGLSIASCMKTLGCNQVVIIEKREHCLMDMHDTDREIAAYIESILVKQEINIITKCTVTRVTETAVYSLADPISTDYRFVSIGTKRKAIFIQNIPSTNLIQLIELASFGRKVKLAETFNDDTGRTIAKPIQPIIQMDYQRVKSMCSLEQGISIAYRTICKCFGYPSTNFLMPSFIYTIPSLLIMGKTRIPADDMFICQVTVPPTIKYTIDTPPRGFGKLWISRIRKTLQGVQLVSEHAVLFGKAFGILIRNQISLVDLCTRIELPGSIGEAVLLMIKQALHNCTNKSYKTS